MYAKNSTSTNGRYTHIATYVFYTSVLNKFYVWCMHILHEYILCNFFFLCMCIIAQQEKYASMAKPPWLKTMQGRFFLAVSCVCSFLLSTRAELCHCVNRTVSFPTVLIFKLNTHLAAGNQYSKCQGFNDHTFLV
jgi:hypothetical protein